MKLQATKNLRVSQREKNQHENVNSIQAGILPILLAGLSRWKSAWHIVYTHTYLKEKMSESTSYRGKGVRLMVDFSIEITLYQETRKGKGERKSGRNKTAQKKKVEVKINYISYQGKCIKLC